MKIINSRLHGLLDYLVSIILIAAPWLFHFAKGGPETWVPVALGVSSIVYSLFTKYELGAVKVFSFKTHLFFDALSGIFLAASPWLLGFAHDTYIPHLLFGILEIIVVFLTKKHTSLENSKLRPVRAI